LIGLGLILFFGLEIIMLLGAGILGGLVWLFS
jgi:hypothetical protein